jgi:hypothetical protein
MSSYFEYEKYSFADWDGYGAEPIAPETVKLGRAIYDLLNGQRPDDAPGGDGSIGFEWRNGEDMMCLDVCGDEFRVYGKMGGKFYHSVVKLKDGDALSISSGNRKSEA